MTPTPRQGPSPFLEGTCIQFAFDSTSLGWLKRCARYYQLAMIEGWKPKDTRFHLEFGIFFTNACEHYDLLAARMGDEYDHEQCLFDTVFKTMMDTWVHYDDEDEYGNLPDGHPWTTDDTAKNRYTLLRSIVWYLDEWHRDKLDGDPAKTVIAEDGTPLVERSFTMELDWGPQGATRLTSDNNDVAGKGFIEAQPYLLCGHLDKVVSFLGEAYWLDHKTTKSTLGSYYFDQYEPHNQATLYTIAGQVIFGSPMRGGIIDAIQSAVGFTRSERGFTHRTQAQLDEWLFDLKYWFAQAERYATDEYWPMNDTACFNCDFNKHGKKICAKDPAVRGQFLKANFTQEEPWNPLLKRN